MAGLVSAIHVAGPKYFKGLSRLAKALLQDGGKPLPFLELDHVDCRDEPGDEPGHDGADGCDYWRGVPRIRPRLHPTPSFRCRLVDEVVYWNTSFFSGYM
jgi:hypothetical protein